MPLLKERGIWKRGCLLVYHGHKPDWSNLVEINCMCRGDQRLTLSFGVSKLHHMRDWMNGTCDFEVANYSNMSFKVSVMKEVNSKLHGHIIG